MNRLDLKRKDIIIEGDSVFIYTDKDNYLAIKKRVLESLIIEDNKKNELQTCSKCLGQQGEFYDDGCAIVFLRKASICKRCEVIYNNKMNRNRRKQELYYEKIK